MKAPGSAGGRIACTRDLKSPPAEPGAFIMLLSPSAGLLAGAFADVEAEQQVLIAEVQLAVRNHRVRPDLPLRLAKLGQRRELEPAVFLPPLGRLLDEHHVALFL